MKPLFYLFAAMLALLLLAGAYVFHRQENADSDETHLEILLRDIGHQVLLRANDSVSRVLPVLKLEKNVYEISFQHTLTFVPDTLVAVVHRRLAKTDWAEHYRVQVKKCYDKKTIFAYEINPTQENIIPCSGRSQEAACYRIQLTFLESNAYSLFWWGTAGLLLSFGAFFWHSRRQSSPPLAASVPESQAFVAIGSYRLYAETATLVLGETATLLSEKEAKALALFAQHLNQVVERERLLKVLWEDEGVFVISRNIDVLVSKLRKKLRDDPAIQLVTVPKRGYKLVVV